jgi:sortase A
VTLEATDVDDVEAIDDVEAKDQRLTDGAVSAPDADPEPSVGPVTEPRQTVPKGSSIDTRRVVRIGLTTVVAAGLMLLLWLVVLSGLMHSRTQRALEQRFAVELLDGTAPVNQPIAPGTPIALIEAPSIGLREVVVEGSRSRQLAGGPGHLRTSALPGQPGVSVIFGRSTAYGGPFSRLGQLEVGDALEVTTGQGIVSYRVSSVEAYSGTDAAAFNSPANALLLVTAHPRLIGSGRLVALAEPDGPLHPRGAQVVQPAATNDELGLEGSSLAAVGLLVWLEVLLLAIGVTALLAFRWRAWPTWVIAVPVIAATSWLTIEYLSLLLPATL